MRLLPFRNKDDNETITDPKLEEAQERLRDLKSRSEQATSFIERRLGRNHWGETIIEIARGRGHNPC